MLEILMVDDHLMLRTMLKTVIELDGTVRVVAEAGTAREGLQWAQDLNFDVAVVDISLPDRDGIWLARALRRERPELPVLILSMHLGSEFVTQAVQAGARGYLPKTVTGPELTQAIHEVFQGRIYIHPQVAPQEGGGRGRGKALPYGGCEEAARTA